MSFLAPLLSPWRANINFWLLLLLALLGLVSLAWDGLVKLPAYWSREEYSHSYLIPLISIMIGWHRLAEKRPVPAPTWLGVWALGAAFFFLSFSYMASFEALLNYSFVVGVMGLILAFFGKSVFVALAPALFFLFFAVPLPHVVHGNLSVQMQLISSTLGVGFLKALGISVFQDGNLIDLGQTQLHVVEACNGLRYLFPLASFSFLFAFLAQDTWIKRILIFLSAAPITIVMNSLRIAMIGVTTTVWGSAAAEGLIHVVEGYVVFLASLAVLGLVTWGLLCLGKGGRFRYEYAGLASGPVLSSKPMIRGPVLAAAAFCLIMAPVLHLGPIKKRAEVIPDHPNLSVFLNPVHGWRGTTSLLEPEVIKTLALTDYFLADYKREGHKASINFYLAYYKSQHVRANIHVPLGCILGSGWRVERQEIVPVPLDGFGRVPLKRVLITKGGESVLSYYWLDQRGRVVNTAFANKWYLFLDALTEGRTDGALVRLATPILKDETPDDADARLRIFLNAAYPLIRETLPKL